jgi:Ca-activated chloride channel family protein
MKPIRLKPLLFVLALIVITGAAMAFAGKGKPAPVPPLPVRSGGDGILTLSGRLVQDSVLRGSDGRVALELTLSAADEAPAEGARGQGVDLVVVLDRSGSMQGQKLDTARRSLQHLLAGLAERDRFALISYSNGVRKHGDLLPVTERNRALMLSEVAAVAPDGGTNLGAGLASGIGLISEAGRSTNPGRVILISDGLANQGVTDPQALGRMASAAAGREFAVSTVGVGSDFNEFLMTLIADRGAGSYYYLADPSAFAEVFQKEFFATRSEAATGLVVSVALPEGARLVDAAGYPVTHAAGEALFHPGGLRSGQTRKMFLTFQVPTDREAQFEIGRIAARYRRGGAAHQAALEGPLRIACVGDEARVFSSIDRTLWEKKVVSDDYNRLKQEVAADIKAGRKDAALEKVGAYAREQGAMNSQMNSEEVRRNIERDLKALEKRVTETFDAPAAAVSPAAKSLQYEGYSGRRSQ